MLERLPKWMQNKWVLYGLSCGVTLILCLLIFLLFLRGPFATLFTNQGSKAFEKGDYEKAAAKYSLALGLKTNREAIYLGYSDALIELGDYEKADKILKKGIDRLSGAEALYLSRARVLSRSGKIGEAADFLQNISDSYINKKLQPRRPGDLSFSPAQGKYSKAQKVTLIQRKGEVIYYTLNGEDPTLSSPVYKEPITLGATTTLTAISVNEEGLVSPRLQITYEIDNADEAIEFTDTKIEKMVRAALNRPTGNLYAAQLAGVTDLTSHGIGGEVRSLKDLEYLPNLTGLHLTDELSIADYTPLANLPGLQMLTLAGCGITDDELAIINACTKLTELSIADNRISDLSVIGGLRFLEYLDASENEISSTMPLDAFPLLKHLSLRNNRLCETDGIKVLTELISLDLSGNYISDLAPLAGLQHLTELSLQGTSPTNIKKLASLPNLAFLDISACGLASLSVVNNFKALTVLRANDNQISSLSTFTLQVTELYISNNPLVDISPLKTRTGLTILEVANTQISDISCLAGFAQLNTLDIDGTNVTDATCLKGCPALNMLICSEKCSTAGLPAGVSVIIK